MSSATAGPATPKGPQSPWEPDPARVNELSQTIAFDKYQMSAPKYLAADQKGVPAGAMTIYSWKIDSGTDVPTATLIAVVTADKTMVAEAQKDMRKTLVNFSAGMTNPSGIEIRKREATETGTLGGMPFSRFKWSGRMKAGKVQGIAYGGLDGGNAVMILPINFGPDGETGAKLMEAIIATLKKP